MPQTGDRRERSVPVRRRAVLRAGAGGSAIGAAGCLDRSNSQSSDEEPPTSPGQRGSPDVDGATWVTPGASSAEINDTIAAAQEAGTSVAFAPGTYELAKDDRLDLQNPAAIRCRDGVDLIAPYGNVTLERVDTMHNMIYAGFDPDTNEPHASNFRIEGFEVVGHRDGYEDPVDSHVNSGIMLYGFAENVTIANNHVHGWHAHGIHADVTNNSQIVNNDIHHCNLGIHPATRFGDGPHHTTIAHNTIWDCDSNGLDGGNNYFCTYVGNTVENCPGGCNVSGTNNAIVGNTLRGNGDGVGIHFRPEGYVNDSEGRDSVAVGNTVEGFSQGTRIRGERCIVANNTFRDLSNRVVWVDESGNGSRISDVRVEGAGYGVLVQADDVTVENVRISGSRAADVAIVEEATGTCLWNLQVEEIQDEGSRTAIGGEATNDGTPANGGEWNGHAERARQFGLTVWDVGGEEPIPYRVDPAGNWRQSG